MTFSVLYNTIATGPLSLSDCEAVAHHLRETFDCKVYLVLEVQ